MAIFLQYQPRDTAIHKLNVVTKTIMLFMFLVLLTMWMDFRLFILVDIVILLVYTIAKVPRSWLIVVLAVMVIPIPLTLFISTFLTDPSLFKVYPCEIVLREFLQINVPYLGSLRLTYGSIFWTAAMLNRFMAFLVFFVYMYTTSVSEILDLLKLLRMPSGFAFSIAVTFKFIPQFIDSLTTTINAQVLRGLDVSATKNPIKKVRKVAPALLPMLRISLDTVEEITLAAQIRAFGACEKPTTVREIKFTRFDIAVSTACLISLGVAIYAYLAFSVGSL